MPDTAPKPRKGLRKKGEPQAKKSAAPDPGPGGSDPGAADDVAQDPREPRGGVGPMPEEPQGSADSPPNKRKRKARGMARGKMTEGLTKLLEIPALPLGLMGDDWASGHFESKAPAFADQLAGLAEKNPAVRKWVERLLSGDEYAGLLFAGLGYFYPLLVHFGRAPDVPFITGGDVPVVGVAFRGSAPAYEDAVSGLGADPPPMADVG